MRILLSAYACEPGKGSEPEVGWGWASQLAAAGHDVCVVTRANNRRSIEEALAGRAGECPEFLYYDLPRWTTIWKHWPGGVYLYYILWQWGAASWAQKSHRERSFDLVHHVTFVSLLLPTFMWRVPIPLIVGPCAGGLRAPPDLRGDFDLRGRLSEWLRDIAHVTARFNPLVRPALRKAKRIFVTSESARKLIPYSAQGRTAVSLAIALPQEEIVAEPRRVPGVPLRLLYAGRLVSWKGVHLAIRALALLVERGGTYTMTVVGTGGSEGRLHRLAVELGVEDAVHWRPWLDRGSLRETYKDHDVLVMPSLHDSGGMVVLEALAAGVPVVCLDLGGPGVMVNDSCGKAVEVRGRDADRVVDDLAASIHELSNDTGRYAACSRGALERATEYTWDRLLRTVYGESR